MILIAPELLRAIESPCSETKYYDLKIIFRTKNSNNEYYTCVRIGRGYPYKRLYEAIKNLEDLGVLEVTYVSNRRIEITISEGFLSFLQEISRITNRHVEMNTNALRLLFLLAVMPIEIDIKTISNIMGLTERAIRKNITKLMELGLIDKKNTITRLGSKLTEIFLSRSLEKLPIVQNPYFYLSLMSSRITDRYEYPKFIASAIKDIISLNPTMCDDVESIVAISISDNKQLPEILGEAMERLDLNSYEIPIVLSRKRLYGIISSLADRISLAFTHPHKEEIRNVVLKEIESRLGEIIGLLNSVRKNALVCLFAPYAILWAINYYLSTKTNDTTRMFPFKFRRKMLFFFRLDKSVLHLKNDITSINKMVNTLWQNMREAFKKKLTIRIEWNVSTANSSYLEIRIKRPYEKQDIFSIEDGDLTRNPIQLIPLGEFRIGGLTDLVKSGYIEVKGEIRVIGEPIIGIKSSSSNWPRRKLHEPELILDLNSDETNIAKMKFSRYEYIPRLFGQKISLEAIHFGANETLTPIKISYLHRSSVATRIRDFIHIIFSGKIRTKIEEYPIINHLFINDARVYVDNTMIWETPKIIHILYK